MLEGVLGLPLADVEFEAFLDGLLFDQIASAGTRDPTAAELHTTIRALLTAVTGKRS